MLPSIFSYLLFIHCVSADDPFDPLIFFGRPKFGTLYDPSTETSFSEGTVLNGTFAQKIDHFSDTSQVWSQHYFQRNMDNSQVAFLVLGGNGDISRSWFLHGNSPYVKWADEHRAILFGLEHRFYGKSKVFRNLTKENLAYLTVSQAMKDVETFIQMQVSYKRVPESHKWILFGGSYAASIALWLRQTNPKLIFGVVASSAPIQAKLDAYEYNMIVEKFFDKNTDCKTCITRTFDGIMRHLKKTEHKTLDTSLKLKKQYDTGDANVGYIDTQFLLSRLQEPFQIVTQYYKTGSRFSKYGMEELCLKIECEKETSDPQMMENLFGTFHDMYQEYYGVEIANIDNDYQNAVNTLKSEANDVTDYDYQHRLWLWQLCNELGYSVTTDYGVSSIFESTVSPTLFITMCKDVFDLELADIRNGIDNTNNMFGGISGYTGTNAVIIKGTYDTYQYFTKANATDKSVRIITINDAGHSSDVFESTDANIVDAQKKISSEIKKMLNAEIAPPDEAATEAPWSVEFRVKKSVSQTKLVTSKSQTSFVRPKLIAETLKLSQTFFGRPPFGFTPTPNWKDDDPIVFDDLSYYTNQPVDHYNDDSAIFNQFSCRNGDYVTDNGPVYLLIGGDSAIDCNWIKSNDSTIVQMAKENGAIIYYLEHRFFGLSKIANKPKFQDLQYLTITQAVRDIGSFVVSMMHTNPTEKSKQWVVFGSSYAGTLAAIARASFPDLIAGAVVSSALLNPQFSNMDNSIQVGKVIEATNKGCADTIKKVFNDLRIKMFAEDGIQPNETFFKEFQDWDFSAIPDQQYFFLNLYSSVSQALFFDKIDSMTEMTPQMTDLCTQVTTVDGLSKYYTKTNSLNQNDGKTLKRLDAIETIKKTYEVDTADEDKATVNWIWLSCNQLASFPTTDAGDGIFGSPVPVDFFVNFCKDTFGTLLDPDYNSFHLENEMRIVEFVINTIEKTLGNVVITSGDEDPRYSLSVPQVSSQNIDYMVLNGTSHGALLYPSSAKDSANLISARKKITEEMRGWHASPPASTSKPPGGRTTYRPPVTRNPDPETSTKSAVTIGKYISFLLFVLIL